MVNSISQAVAVLLYKNMYLPIEDESAFVDEPTQAKSGESAVLQQLLGLLEKPQNVVSQQQQMMNSLRSPRRSTIAVAAPTPIASPNPPQYLQAPPPPLTPFRGCEDVVIYWAMAEPLVVGIPPIGATAKCRDIPYKSVNIRAHSHHMGMPSVVPSMYANAPEGPARYSRACFLCKGSDHVAANCPSRKAFDEMVARQSTDTDKGPTLL
ncbi:Hypothetical protein PHPALM_37402 [Phytophthora palmivora]|uniref:CCHC-type domain-containing protein n=1 Tax=Phytophthora palmivora TaxID=4796 RepID=A0A2P4WXJ4_9STRA|nr:Hypothetical protein PHPALM_37402 [Phytophthora palmivora]